MKPLFQHLENESLLLLYMAGELPLHDREELELMLARDGGLRDQLETLRAAEGASFGALVELDATESSRSIEPAMRRVSRAIEQWQIDRAARPPQANQSRSRMPLLMWSVGSAAAALLTFCIWWGFRSDPSIHDMAVTQPSRFPAMVNDSVADSTPPAAPANGVDDEYLSTHHIQIAGVDASQRIGELERLVSDDVQ